MAVLVSLIHAAAFTLVFLAAAGMADPAGYGRFILFIICLLPGIVVHVLVWITGRLWIALLANLAGAAGMFAWFRLVPTGGSPDAVAAALLFGITGLGSSLALLAWRWWVSPQRRKG